MASRYEIEEGTHAVRVYYGDSEVAGLFQPHWPNGDSWDSAEEAEQWAQLFVASMDDPEAPFAPNARGEEGAPKPTAEEIQAMMDEMEAQNTPAE
jgi:hypothetical protein